jgi:dienelactone hydrolase
VLSEKEKDGVIIQDLTYVAADSDYTSQTAGRIAAYLIKPSKTGSYAGIVYLHGLGGSWGNRREFLDEATSLAQQGVVSLLPTGQFPWVVSYTGVGEKDQMSVIKQVIELRRSFDFLLVQPGVDAKRIAFVGHDYGAMNGAVLSGVEKRIKTYVLMAGDSNYSDWDIMYFSKPSNENSYRKLMSAVDPITYLPHAAPSDLFFQFGGLDSFISKEAADESINAASEPKKVGWYDSANHPMWDKQADLERLTWLKQKLNLKP